MDLLPAGDHRRLALSPGLCQSRWYLGEFATGLVEARAGIDEAAAAGDVRTGRILEIVQELIRSQSDPSSSHRELEAVITAAIADLDEAGDDEALAFAWGRLALVLFWRGRAADALVAVDRGLDHARRTGDPFHESEVQRYAFGVFTWGPMPVEEGLARFEAIGPQFAGDHLESSGIDISAAYLLALAGREDEARERFGRALAESAELGDSPLLASARCQIALLVQRVLGDLEEAERLGRDGVMALTRMGETGYRSTGAAYLADLLAVRGDLDGADEMVEIARESASADDFGSLALIAQARGRILASRGRVDEALRHAREAVDIAENSDYLVLQAEARMALASVLEAAGRTHDAAAEVEDAIERYRRKGAVVLEGRARAERDRLRALDTAD
jgi:tetratricopeptide (TPR) repeat protein